MSREGVATFLTRVMQDEGFRTQLKANPDATLAQFDLTPDEVAAIRSADPAKLQELDIDERVSKAAAIEMGSSAAGSVASGTYWWLTQMAQQLKHLLNP
ncbi:MAG: Os1348 family NHLP clan protein [bacterium]